MPSNMFLQIDGLKGESTDSDHKDWIEILSYTASIVQTVVTSGAGGSAAGRAHQDFSITKSLDSSSPKLYEMCASGKHISKVVLELTRASGGAHVKYMVAALDEAILSSVVSTGASQGVPSETLTFQFSRILWTYTPQTATGSLGSPVTGAWDLTANKAVS